MTIDTRLALIPGMISRAQKLAFPLLFGLFLAALFHQPLLWLPGIFFVPEYRQHAILLAAFCIYFFFHKCLQPHKDEDQTQRICHFAVSPCIAFLISLCAYLANGLSIRSNIAACLCLGLTLFSTAGFFLERKRWLRSANIALLFLLCLPLSYHMETFAGFPLRILSANVAEHVFRAAGNSVHSAATILLIENSYTHVDLPCSGVRSLFSITLFSLLFGFREGYGLGSKWALALAASALFAVAANLLRVILLILLHTASLPEFFRQTLHMPIGMLTFTLACLSAVGVWKRLRPEPIPEPTVSPGTDSRVTRFFLLAALGLTAAVNFLFVQPTENAPGNAPVAVVNAEASALPLTGPEVALFLRHGVSHYAKARFDIEGHEGTVFLVRAASWRGHHHPEQCLQAQGNVIEQSRAVVLPGGRPVRLVTLKNSDTAVLYWFQSATEVTDDYTARVWRAFSEPGIPFVMNSVYVDKGKHMPREAIEKIAVHFFAKSARLLGEQP